MPKRFSGPPICNEASPPKKRDIEPLTDKIGWKARFTEGSPEEILLAIREAEDNKDPQARDALAEVILSYNLPDAMRAEIGSLDELRFVAARAIGDIGYGEDILSKALTLLEGAASELPRETAASLLISNKNPKALPSLIKAIRDERNNADIKMCTLGAIETLAKSGADCRSAVAPLLGILSDPDFQSPDDLGTVADALGAIGDRRAVEPLKNILRLLGGEPSVEAALEKLGVKPEELAPLRESAHEFESEYHRAIHGLVRWRKDIKRLIFENTESLDSLPDKQAWISINDPSLAREAVSLALRKRPDKRQSLDNLLSSSIGMRLRNMDDSSFRYYPDEIIDCVAQVFGQPLSDDGDFKELSSEFRYVSGVRLRYIARQEPDIHLGDKCGDCTAKGSINYGNSLTWLVNPAYNILTMSHEGRFIGKLNFALGSFGGEDAIIIDALEFNPQAAEGMPYHSVALRCFGEAVSFLRELAEKESRSLIALTVSNSGKAVDLFSIWGEPLSEEYSLVKVRLLVPARDIRKTLAAAGYDGKIRLFYQMAGDVSPVAQGRDLTAEKLPSLERTVVNPAQIQNGEIASAMRKRDFGTAAALILADPVWSGKVRSLFNAPPGFNIEDFLSRKLADIYRSGENPIEALMKTFLLDKSDFVRL